MSQLSTQSDVGEKTQPDAKHVEQLSPAENTERVPEALARDVSTLPLSYFFSPKFLGYDQSHINASERR